MCAARHMAMVRSMGEREKLREIVTLAGVEAGAHAVRLMGDIEQGQRQGFLQGLIDGLCDRRAGTAVDAIPALMEPLTTCRAFRGEQVCSIDPLEIPF